MKKILILIIIIFILIVSPSHGDLSENIYVDGKIEAWHEGQTVKDVAKGSGIINYASESYPDGRSSGFDLQNGKGSFSFKTNNYHLEVSNFNGTIVSESNDNLTTFTGNGTGRLKAKSFEIVKQSSLGSAFPSGEINAIGNFELNIKYINSYKSNINQNDLLNESEGLPENNTNDIFIINDSMEFPL